jgi:hypothetical protein
LFKVFCLRDRANKTKYGRYLWLIGSQLYGVMPKATPKLINLTQNFWF